MEHTRYEDFITTTRNPIKVLPEGGVKKDGTFTARYGRSILDAGAHATHGAEVINVHGFAFLSSYACDNAKWEGKSVYTNNMIGGGYRGYGAPQACFAFESLNDEICDTLGLDPIEFRKKNARAAGRRAPARRRADASTPTRWKKCWIAAPRPSGWSQRHPPAQNGDGTKKRGIGMALFPFWVSGCVGFPDIYEHSGAIVKLNVDGTADVATASVDIGSGQITTLLQIAAEELGLPMDAMRMVRDIRHHDGALRCADARQPHYLRLRPRDQSGGWRGEDTAARGGRHHDGGEPGGPRGCRRYRARERLA